MAFHSDGHCIEDRERGRKLQPKPNYAMQQHSDNMAAPPSFHRIVKESEPESVRNCVFSNVTGEVSENTSVRAMSAG